MEIGTIVRSKSTGKIYEVIEQKTNRDGFTAEDSDGEQYYFFESEVDIISKPTSETEPCVTDVDDADVDDVDDVSKAFRIIESDLIQCENAIDIGRKYKTYSEKLSQIMLNALDKLYNEN